MTTEDPPSKIKPVEIVLFMILGVLPLLAIYFFASQGMGDERGQQAEQQRRLFMADCLAQLEDREKCRLIVDENYQACFKSLASEQGVFPDKAKATTCITGREDGKYRPKPIPTTPTKKP